MPLVNGGLESYGESLRDEFIHIDSMKLTAQEAAEMIDAIGGFKDESVEAQSIEPIARKVEPDEVEKNSMRHARAHHGQSFARVT